MPLKTMRYIVTISMALALFVTMLGAYTRLTDAGLGCPDWPGCYGQMILPKDTESLTRVQEVYPNIPIETKKAWTEMSHRYAAGTLGVLILIIFGLSFTSSCKKTPKLIPRLLLGLVIFQALLGMWTVTLNLLPIVVIGHLLGGMLIFSCLCLYRLQISSIPTYDLFPWNKWIKIALFLLIVQIILGGLVSANYAGLACTGFPKCNGQWAPPIDVMDSMKSIKMGANFGGGITTTPLKILIQYIHRLFGLIVSSYMVMLSIIIVSCYQITVIRVMAITVLALIFTQVSLGVINVLKLMPIWSTVAHNGCAALLLATMIGLVWLSKKRDLNARC